MPREQGRTPGTRVKPEFYDVFKRTAPKVDVVARPTDPYVEPPTETKHRGIAEIAEEVNRTAQTFSKDYKAHKDWKNGRATAQGELDRMKGVELDSNETKAYIAGYEKMAGKMDVIEFKKELDQLLEQSQTMSLDEVDAAYAAIHAKYTGGSDEQLRGFLPGAVEAEESFYSLYQKQQMEILHDEREAKAAAIDGDYIEDKLRGMMGANMDLLMKNPTLYKSQYLDRQGEFSTTAAPMIRQYLDEQITEGKTIGRTASEVSASLFNTVSYMAEKYGMPELLDYADLPGKDGFSLVDTKLKDAVETSRRSARAAQAGLLTGMQKAETEKKKESQNTILRQYSKRMQDIPLNDPQVATEAIADLDRDAEIYDLPAAPYEARRAALVAVRDGYGIPKMSNAGLKGDFDKMLFYGTLTPEMVDKAVHELSPADRSAFYKALEAKEAKREAAAKDGREKQYFDKQRLLQDTVRRTIALVTPKLATNELSTGTGVELRAWETIADYLDTYSAEHDGAEPSHTEFREWIKSSGFYDDFPQQGNFTFAKPEAPPKKKEGEAKKRVHISVPLEELNK